MCDEAGPNWELGQLVAVLKFPMQPNFSCENSSQIPISTMNYQKIPSKWIRSNQTRKGQSSEGIQC